MSAALIECRAKIEKNRKESKKTSFQLPSEIVRRSMIVAYPPKKFGKRMLCHSTIKDLRVVFIASRTCKTFSWPLKLSEHSGAVVARYKKPEVPRGISQAKLRTLF